MLTLTTAIRLKDNLNVELLLLLHKNLVLRKNSTQSCNYSDLLKGAPSFDNISLVFLKTRNESIHTIRNSNEIMAKVSLYQAQLFVNSIANQLSLILSCTRVTIFCGVPLTTFQSLKKFEIPIIPSYKC